MSLWGDSVADGIVLNGGLSNTGYIKTSTMSVDGDLYNYGKVTVVGDVYFSGNGVFSNSSRSSAS